MALKPELRTEAISDLEYIWRYTAEKWSEEQAEVYYRLIIETIEGICINPEAGKPYRSSKAGYRVTFAGSHLIFYRTHPSTIEVVRILHERMDISGRLKK